MSDKQIPSPDVLRQAILDLNEPVVFRGIINNDDNWRLLELSKFVEFFGDEPLPFRTTQNVQTPEPQWDLTCPVQRMSIKEFMEKSENNNESDESYYFDYKYMHQWFQSKPEILNAVNWRCFGFEKFGNDSTLWIGSKGSHTNCHQDTYGCNLISQIHGRKQWLLLPPDAGDMLQQTRVPYEESTVYSELNFFCPSRLHEEAIVNVKQTPKLVTLEPGEVLFVPRGWWHYVESLDLTCSINVWLQLDSDYKERVKEAVVQFLMNKFEQLTSDEESFSSDAPSTSVIEACLKSFYKSHTNIDDEPKEKKIRKTPWNVKELTDQYPGTVVEIQNLTREELRKLIVAKRERFPQSINQQNIISTDTTKTSEDIIKQIVKTICHNDVIEQITCNLLSN